MDNDLDTVGDTAIEAYDPSKYVDAGKETIEEEIIPRMHLCQPGSPEVATEEIAKLGDMVVRPSALGINFGNTLTCCIIASHKEWVLWGDRDKREGIKFRGTKATCEAYQAGCTEWVKDEKTGKNVPPEATETRNFCAIEYDTASHTVDPNNYGPVVVSMSVTSAKAGKNLNMMLKQCSGPIFAMMIEVTTKKETDGKNTWAEYRVRSLGELTDINEHGATLGKLATMYEAFRAATGGAVASTED